ncbi:MAG: hypothetical protein M1824_001206 [Vezdaea acicularis]|nr:MAG: hypothetical protein M1824_001206 [Vezdaea acicularis]
MNLADEELDSDSASDEDFNPVPVPQDHASSTSSSDSETSEQPGEAPKSRKKRKRKSDDKVEDIGFENSGDEGIIRKGRRKQKKKRENGENEADEGAEGDEGTGEGGFVKTRRQRKEEKTEKRYPLQLGAVTADIDSIYASLISRPLRPPSPLPPLPVTSVNTSEHSSAAPSAPSSTTPKPLTYADNEMITITQTYSFAGVPTSTTKTVPKNSEEAKLYLAQQRVKSSDKRGATEGEADNDTAETPSLPLRRPKFRPSRFDPNFQNGTIHFPSSSTVVASSSTTTYPQSAAPGPKLNTLQKSKLDWAGYVDQQGIAEELGEMRKGKGEGGGGFMDRQGFLERVQDRREEMRRGGLGSG